MGWVKAGHVFTIFTTQLLYVWARMVEVGLLLTPELFLDNAVDRDHRAGNRCLDTSHRTNGTIDTIPRLGSITVGATGERIPISSESP